MQPSRPDDPPAPSGAERLLQQFEAAWRAGASPRLESYLAPLSAPGPAAPHPARQDFLKELIRLDLEYAWRAKRDGTVKGPVSEDYLRRYPELNNAPAVLIELIGEEYRARRRWGDKPGHAEYPARFPRFASQLQETLPRIDLELAGEFGRRRSDPAEARAIWDSPFADRPAALKASPDQASSDNVSSDKVLGEPVSQPVGSVPGLMDALRQSHILSAAQLDGLTSANRQWADAKALAGNLIQRGWLTPFQVNQLLLGRAGGLEIGPYLLLERLGEGGVGQVFKARHQKLDRIVALKIIRRELLSDAEAVARFHREIEVLSRLDHPNVVHAIDAGQSGTVHFLAMEYVEGTDLGRLVKQGGRLPVEQACEYIRQAACGLDHAHQKGLVHRDIKPHNLIMSLRDGLIKVADLGLARLPRGVNDDPTEAISESRTTGTLTPENAVLIGTADYLAPEQAINFHQADIRADIYSLGCSFYFLLTGQPPYPGGTLAEKLARHLQGVPPVIEDSRKDLPPGLANVMRKMLANRPQDRYQTPREVAAALAPYSSPHGPPRPSRWAVWRNLDRRRALVGVGIALAGGCVPLSMYLFGPTPFQRLSRKLADPTTPVAEAWQDYQNFCARFPGTAEADQALPLMLRYLLEARAQFPGTPQAIEAGYRLTLLPSSLDQLPEGADPQNRDVAAMLGKRGEPGVGRMAFSPDCKLVAQSRETNEVEIWDASTAKKLFSLVGHKSEITGLAFSPRGRLLASASYDKTIKLWDVTTRKERTWEMPGGAALAFSPDGKTLASSIWDNPNIYLWEVESGQKRTIRLEGKPIRSIAFSPNGRTLAAVTYQRPPILWNLATEKEWPIPGLPVATALAFSPDGLTLALAVPDGPIQLWDLTEGKLWKSLGQPTGRAFLAYTPDGKRLLGGELRLWDIASGQSLWQSNSPGSSQVAAFAADGRHAAVPYVFAGFLFRIPARTGGK